MINYESELARLANDTMRQSIASPATRDLGTVDTIPGTVTLKLPESTSPVAGTVPGTVPGMYNQSPGSRGHDTVM